MGDRVLIIDVSGNPGVAQEGGGGVSLGSLALIEDCFDMDSPLVGAQ